VQLKRHQASYPVKGNLGSASLFLQRGDTTKIFKADVSKNTCLDLVGDWQSNNTGKLKLTLRQP
jgi:hypothetical protein